MKGNTNRLQSTARQKYFVNDSDRKKLVYCSELCGRLFTSRLANTNRRTTEHKKKLSLAHHLSAKWLNTKTNQTWKEWVFEHSERSIKKNWLTRAVKSGDIIEPFK